MLDGILVLAIAIAALVALPRVAAGVVTGLEQLATSIQAAVPLLQGRGSIDLPAGGSTSVGAAPVVDSLPEFTREPQLQLSGRVPAFAVQEGRTLQIVLNGVVVSSNKLGSNGTFGAALALKEGANSISVSLLADRDLVAATAHTVVLDRTPPTLTLSRPPAGGTVDTQNIIVAGTTEPGSTITVNGRTVVTTPEGAFNDSFSAAPGLVQITVLSRDRAGNETTEKLSVVGVQLPSAITAAVTVTLDRPTVRPGQTVTATIRVTEAGRPRVGVTATLSVGIVTIGTAVTDATGTARISFAAPSNEGDASVVVLAAGASGRAALTIAAR
ncbi:MAG TPA: hypothetical protein VGR87_13045 [Candidatus Limnocylindria bacterium]|nr:hypothetical protein [Candidatus Limnocylindria bacterium]